MLSKLFPRRAPIVRTACGSIPPGQRIYAVGDIHGRLDLLEELLAKIEEDDSKRPTADNQLIFLGDLIDRGPQSAQVVERLIQLSERRHNLRFLLGNHEEVFLRAVGGDLKALTFFHRIGGRETILSYGIDRCDYDRSDNPMLMARVQSLIPRRHLDFVAGFEDMIIVGDYAFVHAGVRPGHSLATQKVADLRWIRGEFLSAEAGFEKIIVHGHSISSEVQDLPHRIGLDTGAYRSGTLTAMGFEGDRRWVIQTGTPK